jgi:hypothetical protein
LPRPILPLTLCATTGSVARAALCSTKLGSFLDVSREELVRKAISAINEPDVDAYLACFTNDVQLYTPLAAFTGPYEGPSGRECRNHAKGEASRCRVSETACPRRALHA